ncbi:MAG: hypothetical protein JWM42_3937 [Burkholderia sp.]|nr:hypothetical protein [Burkholderia sp.]
MARENYDDARRGVWFSIDIEDDEFLMFVSDEALQVHFEATGTKEGQLAAFREHKERIMGLARQRFLDGAARPIKLCVADFAAVAMHS